MSKYKKFNEIQRDRESDVKLFFKNLFVFFLKKLLFIDYKARMEKSCKSKMLKGKQNM
jgi:hypothetical protein